MMSVFAKQLVLIFGLVAVTNAVTYFIVAGSSSVECKKIDKFEAPKDEGFENTPGKRY